jgi:hypothetical protein
MSMTNERTACILAAYRDALAERDPADVAIEDLVPSIFAAVPDATVSEIVLALRTSAERLRGKAAALQTYSRLKHPINDNEEAARDA